MTNNEEREALSEFLHMTIEELENENTPPGRKEFKLVGLSAGQKFTCNTDKEDCFWVDSCLSEDRYRAMFRWAKSDDGFWKQKWVVVIQHQGLYKDGAPKKPVALEVKLKES